MFAASKNWRLRQRLWTSRCVPSFTMEPSLGHRWILLLTSTANCRRRPTLRRPPPAIRTLPVPVPHRCIIQTTRPTTLDLRDLHALVATLLVLGIQYPKCTASVIAHLSHLPRNTTGTMSPCRMAQHRYTQVTRWSIQVTTSKSSDRHLRLIITIIGITILHRRLLPLTSYRRSTGTVSAPLRDR